MLSKRKLFLARSNNGKRTGELQDIQIHTDPLTDEEKSFKLMSQMLNGTSSQGVKFETTLRLLNKLLHRLQEAVKGENFPYGLPLITLDLNQHLESSRVTRKGLPSSPSNR